MQPLCQGQASNAACYRGKRLSIKNPHFPDDAPILSAPETVFV
jgi:hypothetical protein